MDFFDIYLEPILAIKILNDKPEDLPQIVRFFLQQHNYIINGDIKILI